MSVYRLIMELVGKDKGATQALRQTKKAMQEVEEQADRLDDALKIGAVALAVAYAGKQFIGAAWDLGVLGAQAERTEASFNRLAGRIGETGDELLQALKRASDGTVDDMTLMQSTAGLLASGIKTSSSEMAMAMEIARMKAQQFGISTTEAYDRMLTGARKFSVEMLDEIGITIKAESAYKRRAEALNKLVKDLSDAERAEALWKAIIQEGTAEYIKFGGATDDGMTKIEQMTSSFDNLKVSIGKFVDPYLESAAEGLYVLAEAAQGNKGPLEDLQRRQERTQYFVDEAGRAYTRTASGALIYDQALTDLNATLHTAEDVGDSWQRAQEANAAAAEYATTSTFQLSGAIQSLTGPMSQVISLGDQFEQTWLDIGAATNALGMQLDDVMRDIGAISGEELVSGFRGDVSGLDAALLGIAGMAPASTIRQLREDYQAELRALYDGVAFQIAQGTDVSEFEIELQARGIYDAYKEVIDSIEDSTSGIEDALADQERAWDNLKSTVEAALRPTQVTALDMYQTEMGTYVDKWDEDARRLDAIAARGFAELEAHPDWAEALSIPPEILGANEEVLKEWARQQSDMARNLMLPMDKDQIRAAVDAVHAYIQQEAQRERNIEIIAGAYQAQYGGTMEQAKAALGDTEAIGGIAADDVIAGFTDALKASSPVAQFEAHLKDGLDAQTRNLKDTGDLIWQAVELGMQEAIQRGEALQWFAEELAGPAADELKRRGLYVAGGNPP